MSGILIALSVFYHLKDISDLEYLIFSTGFDLLSLVNKQSVDCV